MNIRVHKSKLASELGSSPFQLVLGIGFDQRCFTVLEALLDTTPRQIIGLMNLGWSEANSPNVQQYLTLTGGKGALVGDNCKSTLEIADKLSATVDTFDKNIRTVIDITSMSHELLSILMAVLNVRGRLDQIILCYTGAEAYSFNTPDSEIWLSKGISTIRSILGYPGEQLPSQPLHLVIPVGFEVERAVDVITAYEPAILSLGVGRQEDSVSEVHHKTNMNFFNKLEEFIMEQERSCETLTKFSFSCVDPFQAKKDIGSHLANFKNVNTVICPLNTKISTVGIALYCFEHPEVQLCYAQPLEYNTSGYAKASDSISVIQLLNV